MDFRTTSIVELAAAVRTGSTSARELTQAALDRIDRWNPEINAFVAVDPERSLTEADSVDAQVARGDDPGPLAGIPIGVKDLEDAVGFVTTHGSQLDATAPPASDDSLLVARLRSAGAVVVGKTNTPEFGHKAQTDNLVFGPTRNPWDLDRSPGGSSGGTSAALAAGLVPLATGSDGGGSIRIPSAVTALSGHKPSLGRIPTGAEVPEWGDLSVRGPMALDIADVAWALDTCVGPDARDQRSLPAPTTSWYEAVRSAEPPRRVVWSPDLGFGRTDADVLAACRRSVEVLEGLGTEVVEVDVWDHDPVEAWLLLAMTGCERTLGPLRDTERWESIDPGLRVLMDIVVERSAADHQLAADEASRLHVRLAEVLGDADALLTPTVAGKVAGIETQGTIDGEETFEWVSYTYPFNLTRNPAGTTCAGFTSEGWPVGLQVVGGLHDDVGVLSVISVLEQALDLDRRAPYAREQ